MNQEIKFKDAHHIDMQLIPESLYNKKLSEEQRLRLASGKQSGLIKDIIIEEGRAPVDAKVSANINKEGKLELTYDYAEKIFKMPAAILGMKLTPDQKDKLFNGDLLSVKYEGGNLYVGIDRDLNKITVKSDKQIGIPSEIANYKLNSVDKYYLAQGKQTETHLFKTPEGDHFTAKFSMTQDSNGVAFSDIKFVDKENVKELALKYNADKTITDENLMLPPVRITESASKNADPIELNPKVFSKKIVTSPFENSLHNVLENKIENGNDINKPIADPEKQSRRPIIEYKNVNATDKGFNIEAAEYFAPYTLKGVKLTEEQRKAISNGEKTLVQGMDIKGKKTDAYVQIKQDGSGFDWDFKSAQSPSKSLDKALSKTDREQYKIER